MTNATRLLQNALTRHIILSHQISSPYPLGVSKIFDLKITMIYIGKNFSRHYDVTSGPIDTTLNNSFIASNYVTVPQIWRKSDEICGNNKYDAFGAFLYCTNTTGTGSCSTFHIWYKNSPWFPLPKALIFFSNRIIGWEIRRLCRHVTES